MRTLLIAGALLLSACAAVPTPPRESMQSTSAARVVGFATLAEFGTWEFELAPAFTRLALVRHRAARAVELGRISVDTAKSLLAVTDRARSLLDASRRGSEKNHLPTSATAWPRRCA